MSKTALFSVIIMTLVANATQQSSCPVESCTNTFIIGGYTNVHRLFCKGELIITPELPRTFKKCQEGNLRCTVFKNKRKNRHRFQFIRVHGTCCWEISDRYGETEIFGPGQERQPKIAYVSKMKTVAC